MVIRYGGSKVEVENDLSSPKRVLKNARKRAVDEGVLPHEWLLNIMLGKPVKQRKVQITCDAEGNEISREVLEEDYYADFQTRFEAAKASAPFFAPRHAVVHSKTETGSDADRVVEALKSIAEKLPV